jgi:hypothetical protein
MIASQVMSACGASGNGEDVFVSQLREANLHLPHSGNHPCKRKRVQCPSLFSILIKKE